MKCRHLTLDDKEQTIKLVDEIIAYSNSSKTRKIAISRDILDDRFKEFVEDKHKIFYGCFADKTIKGFALFDIRDTYDAYSSCAIHECVLQPAPFAKKITTGLVVVRLLSFIEGLLKIYPKNSTIFLSASNGRYIQFLKKAGYQYEEVVMTKVVKGGNNEQ